MDPCSERLPEIGKDVIISMYDHGELIVSIGCKCDEYYWDIEERIFYLPNDYVIAWMPLPESYKGE